MSAEVTQGAGASEDSATALPAGCSLVGADALVQIQVVPSGNQSFELTKGASFESPDHPDQVFVAAQLRGEGLGDDTIGVWSTVSLLPLGTIFLAVDQYAQEFTGWPEAATMAGRIGKDDPVVQEARNCLAR